MILLSKLIKSPYARTLHGKAKTIAIRQIVQQPEPLENDLSQEKDLPKVNIDLEKMIQEAKKEAEMIVRQALNEANAIRNQIMQEKEQAEEEIALLKEQAKQEGYHEGFHQGELQAKEQYESLIKEAQAIIELAKSDYLAMIEKSEPVIIDLAMAVTTKIIGDCIDKNDEAWNNIVKKVITEVREHEEIKLYVHPNFYEQTLRQKEELQNLLVQGQELYIFPSVAVDEHTCIVETPYGRIDATLSSQLEEIKAKLHEKLREGLNESL